MADQRLIYYIRESLKQGVSGDEIRQSLLDNQWTPEQIREGFYLAGNRVETSVAISTNSAIKFKIFFVIVGLIFLAGIIFGGFILLKSFDSIEIVDKDSSNNLTEIETIPLDDMNNSKQNIPIVDKDIEDFMITFDIIKKANKEKDNNLYGQYLTEKTKSMVNNGFEPIWYTEMELLNTKKEGNNIIANLKLTYENGRTEEMENLFIKENDFWKLAIIEQLEKLSGSLSQSPVANNPNELADLVVTDIKTYPNIPKINDENTEIEVLIKNIGTGSTLGNIDLSWQFNNDTPAQGQIIENILPGNTYSFKIKPYLFSFQKKDQVGDKIIKIILDPDNSMKESNESNNTFEKKVNFVE